MDLDEDTVKICTCLSSSISSPCGCTTKDEDDLEDPYDDVEDLAQKFVKVRDVFLKPGMIKVKRTCFYSLVLPCYEGWTHVDATEVFGGHEMDSDTLE